MTLENTILTILLYSEDVNFYIPLLNIDDFTTSLTRNTFKAMEELYSKGEKVDYLSVAQRMGYSKDFVNTFELYSFMNIHDISKYIEELKQETAKRNLKKLLVDSENKLLNGDEITEIVNNAIKSLNSITSISKSKLVDLGEIEPNYANTERVVSGFSNLDKMIGGFRMGELSVWSGRSGQGKSTFLSQIMLETVNKGYKVCAYSGELINEQFQHWLLLQACGNDNLVKKYDTVKQCDVYVPSSEAVNKIRAWLKGKFFLYNNEFTGNDNNILDVFRYAYKNYGCKVFLVDNLMTAKYDYGTRESYYIQQSQFVGELVRFAKTYNVHIHLIAHPKKTQGELTKEDISGSLDITNRADNAFTVNRLEDGTTEVKILKNRSQGTQNQFVKFNFDTYSKRFIPTNSEFSKYKKYGWEREEIEL